MSASTAALPPLPLRHSYWVVPGLLLAGEHPGGSTRDKTRDRLKKLLAAGIECFVDLTKPTELQRYDTQLPFYVEYARKPIKDHGLPGSRAQMTDILEYVATSMRAGRPVYVHCRAGIGRTGTVIGCLLVERGLAGDVALDELNRLWQQCKRSKSWAFIPETDAQAAYVREWKPTLQGGGFELNSLAEAVSLVGPMTASADAPSRMLSVADVEARAASQVTGAGQARSAVQNPASGKRASGKGAAGKGQGSSTTSHAGHAAGVGLAAAATQARAIERGEIAPSLRAEIAEAFRAPNAKGRAATPDRQQGQGATGGRDAGESSATGRSVGGAELNSAGGRRASGSAQTDAHAERSARGSVPTGSATPRSAAGSTPTGSARANPAAGSAQTDSTGARAAAGSTPTDSARARSAAGSMPTDRTRTRSGAAGDPALTGSTGATEPPRGGSAGASALNQTSGNSAGSSAIPGAGGVFDDAASEWATPPARRLESAVQSSREPAAHFDPLLDPDTLAAARGLRERFVGTLLGLAVGDAVAAATQFRRPGSFSPIGDMIGGGPFDLPRGAWSDDTAMALCLAESLLECDGFDPRDQVQRYSRWQQEGYLSATGQCVGITASTARSLAIAKWRRVVFPGSHDPEQLDPEPLSRVGSIALFYFASLETTLQQAAESSRTTCQAPAVLDACRRLGWAMNAALAGQPKARILSDAGSLGEGEAQMNNTTAATALAAALWAFGSTGNYRDAVLRAANVGGNSDVVAAVCGQIAGAHYGFSAIPSSWRNGLMQKDLIEGYADRLLAHGLVALSN